ncbi:MULTISPECIES: hypothetical protein [unclassified Burkholderia]|nr:MULTISPECIES: hypothetical protein [unclassified Burkholderia]
MLSSRGVVHDINTRLVGNACRAAVQALRDPETSVVRQKIDDE